MPAVLQGLIPPFPTPTNADGSVNFPVIKKLVDHLFRNGCTGVIALGGVGEYQAFSPEDRLAIVKATIEAVQGRGPVIAGVQTSSFLDAKATCLQFKEAGVDAVLVVPPTMAKPTQVGVRKYYKALKEAVDMPIVLYDEPDSTHFLFEPATIAGIVEDGSVTAVKASNKSVDHFNRTVSLIKGRVPLLAGSTGTFATYLALGAVGGTIGNACLMPATFVRIHELIRDGHLQEALDLHRAILPFGDQLVANGYMASFKQAMRLVGIDCGAPLMPMEELPPEKFAPIAKAYEALVASGVLKYEQPAI